MLNEIELKLLVQPHFLTFLQQEMSHYAPLAQSVSLSQNTYYDSADRLFAQQKMGLRVRQQGGKITQTLKTQGEVKGGLHIRPEYNVTLPSAEPNLALLVEKCGVNFMNFDQIKLQPLFTTNFTRHQWQIECGNGTEIEIAFDQGQIEAAGKVEPICEVEFELKSGNLLDLLHFVQNLPLEENVRLGSLSKAQRGYQLADNVIPTQADWLAKWRNCLEVQQSAVDFPQKMTALFQFEQDLIEETFALGTAYFAADFLRTVERVGAFFNLYHFYVTDFAKLAQSAVENGNEICVQEVQHAHQDYKNAIHQLIVLHSESKDNALVIKKLFSLLQNGQYVKRMINLIQLGMTK